MHTTHPFCRPIQAELGAVRLMLSRTLQADNSLLASAFAHLLASPGKALRPILLLLSAKHTGLVGEKAINAAVAMELLHTASLVHDDVVDESLLRRGQPSLNALHDNRRAVLVGDYLFSRSLTHICLTRSLYASEQLAWLGQTLSSGELRQLTLAEDGSLSEELYYTIIEEKTASLFAVCARIGASLAGADEASVEAMGEYGRNVGICFQLRDDIFDYDDANETGKPTGNDMREGKLTLPLLHALLTAGDASMLRLAAKVRRAEAEPGEIAELVAFARRSGGIDYARGAMLSYAEKAKQCLRPGADAGTGEALRLFADYAARRTL